MSTVTRTPLSGKTNSLPIAVTASASPGNTTHTATAASGVMDEVWLWITNSGLVEATVTFEFVQGASTVTKAVGVPPRGEFLVCPGISYGDGVVIKAFSDIDDGSIVVDGHVNRMDFN